MKQFLVCWALLGLACSRAEPGAPPAASVGMRTRVYVDSARRNWSDDGPRPLRTSIWYPAAAGAPETSILPPDLPFTVEPVAEDAPIARGGRLPLILMSHGTGGSAIQLMWLGRHLAAHGYIVAAINHHGNTGAEPRMAAQGFLLYWERARDLGVALDALLGDSLFGSRIDPARVGAAGFSLGGYTVLAAAGARFDPARYDAFCASVERDFTCRPQLEMPDAHARFAALRDTSRLIRESLARAGHSYRDPRIRAVLAIAPALGGGFAEDDVRDISVPVRIVAGSADSITPVATNAARFARLIPGSELTIFPEAVGHYTFLARCTERGETILAICREAPGVSRAEMHDRVRAIALRHFTTALAR